MTFILEPRYRMRLHPLARVAFVDHRESERALNEVRAIFVPERFLREVFSFAHPVRYLQNPNIIHRPSCR